MLSPRLEMTFYQGSPKSKYLQAINLRKEAISRNNQRAPILHKCRLIDIGTWLLLVNSKNAADRKGRIDVLATINWIKDGDVCTRRCGKETIMRDCSNATGKSITDLQIWLRYLQSPTAKAESACEEISKESFYEPLT